MHFFKKILLSILSILLLPVVVLALENDYPSILGNSLSANPDLAEYVSYFVNISITISAMLAGLVIVFGGLQYIISGAMGKSNSEAKEWIKSGTLGMFLLISAYIILSTINPALVNPKVGQLLNVIPFVNISVSDVNQTIEKEYYKEIPIGTLTEAVLANTASCYVYDEFGDPILEEVRADNGNTIDGPKHLNNDRADCMLELNKAIEKKTKVIKELAKKIADLMKDCNCQKNQPSLSTSSSSTEPQLEAPDLDPSSLLDFGNCVSTGDCPSQASISDVNDCESKGYCGPALPCNCTDKCEPNEEEFELCPQGTKKLVQEGPIIIGALDWPEFTSALLNGQNNSSPEYFYYVDSLYRCMTTNKSIDIPGKAYKGLQEFATTINAQQINNLIDTTVKINGKDIIIMNKTNWDNLKLIEQLIYLKEKLKKLNQTLSQDNINLASAIEELDQCYLPTPYVDYIKRLEQTNNNDKLLMIQKNYNDSTKNFTDISKYCNGFGYTNSDCFYKCENACPSTHIDAIKLFATCQTQDCNKICTDNSASCLSKINQCKFQESACLATKFYEKSCPYGSGDYNNFQECITSCQNQCQDDCQEKFTNCTTIKESCEKCNSGIDPKSNYPYSCQILSQGFCSDEFEKCQKYCTNDSQCLLNNKEKCLYNPESIIKCSVNDTDEDNYKNCIENIGFTCKYGSSQQAGYADCLEKPYSLKDNFSSSYIYKNQFQQKCENPFSPDPTSSCFAVTNPKSPCISVCPEVTKCPSASNCSTCPCTTTDIDTNASNFDPKGKAFYSVYAHMKNINVTIGQVVNQGDIIGQISNIGTNMASHLHFAVGFENGKTGLDVATSFDINSKVTANGTSGIAGAYTTPLPNYANENYKNYVLNNLMPPVNNNQCGWKQLSGSYLHNNTASHAQDWVCEDGSQEGVNVQVMAGGRNIKSTISNIIPASGAVIIKHEVDKNVLSSLINSIISDFGLISGQCQEYKYNDDPLTFYCKQDWWNEPALQEQEPLANNYVCPKEKEIPVGQAVDNSQKWAKKLLQYQGEFILKTEELIKHLQKIALEKDYCKCGSDCGNSEKTCNAPCSPKLETDPDTGAQSCICVNQGCQGNPCQKLINLLLGKELNAPCPKNEKIDGPEQIYNQIKAKLNIINDFIIKNRTDILKELIYSRKTMNECSSESKANTVAEQTRLESCRRIRNNFVSPIADDKTIINNKEINYPCYGIDLGDIFLPTILETPDSSSSSSANNNNKSPTIPATDNWFCCVPND